MPLIESNLLVAHGLITGLLLLGHLIAIWFVFHPVDRSKLRSKDERIHTAKFLGLHFLLLLTLTNISMETSGWVRRIACIPIALLLVPLFRYWLKGCERIQEQENPQSS
jgi:hypothetical protein